MSDARRPQKVTPRAGLSKPDDGTCSTCGWWNTEDDDNGAGHCRRYAPRPVADGVATQAVWPITRAAEWCGEWATKHSDAQPGVW